MRKRNLRIIRQILRLTKAMLKMDLGRGQQPWTRMNKEVELARALPKRCQVLFGHQT